MRKVSLSLVMLAVAASSGLMASEAAACRCMLDNRPVDVQIKEALAGADVVFVGTAEAAPKPAPNVRMMAPRATSFKVLQYWKATTLGAKVSVEIRDGAACGIGFTAGQTYVVYANRAKAGSGYDFANPGSCRRRTAVVGAPHDWLTLGAGKKPATVNTGACLPGQRRLCPPCAAPRPGESRESVSARCACRCVAGPVGPALPKRPITLPVKPVVRF